MACAAPLSGDNDGDVSCFSRFGLMETTHLSRAGLYTRSCRSRVKGRLRAGQTTGIAHPSEKTLRLIALLALFVLPFVSSGRFFGSLWPC